MKTRTVVLLRLWDAGFAGGSRCKGTGVLIALLRRAGVSPTGTEETRWKLCWQVIDGQSRDHRRVVQAGADGGVDSAHFRCAALTAFRALPRGLTTLSRRNAWLRLTVTQYNGLPGTRTVIGTNHETCKEVRDRGLVWEDWGASRRGQELVLWSILHASNYKLHSRVDVPG